jgi:hypothetical protein
MGRGVRHYAQVSSVKAISFGFPYDGPQNAMLILRKSPGQEGGVLLSFDHAHFLCHADACSVLVRFDDKKAEKCAAWLRQDGIEKVLQGVTDIQQVSAVCN